MSLRQMDRDFHIAFSYFSKIGPSNMQKLEKYFPSLEEAFNSSPHDLEKAGLKPKIIEDFLIWRKSFSLSEALSELEINGLRYLTWHEPEYPFLLKEIPAPPPIIYFKGRLDNNTANRLAVVGSRDYSAYGDKIIKELLPPIIKEGVHIVSGLAIGVDSAAHNITLENHGTTLAVLGSGLDNGSIYPRSNKRLADEIVASGGAIISEFPPRTPPLKQNFPQRNRIISGLSQATLVIEAKEKSGALITANFSLHQNREVLAIPGNIFSPVSAGPNNLIKSGAKAITMPEEILEVFHIFPRTETALQNNVKKQKIVMGNDIENLIYAIIRQAEERAEKISADEIIKISKLDTPTINSKLSILEIKGVIKNTGSGYELI